MRHRLRPVRPELGGRPGTVSSTTSRATCLPPAAASPVFQEGLGRVLEAAQIRRIALLSSEEDPSRCHRHPLIGRILRGRGVAVSHIRRGGSIDTEAELAARKTRRRPAHSLRLTPICPAANGDLAAAGLVPDATKFDSAPARFATVVSDESWTELDACDGLLDINLAYGRRGLVSAAWDRPRSSHRPTIRRRRLSAALRDALASMADRRCGRGPTGPAVAVSVCDVHPAAAPRGHAPRAAHLARPARQPGRRDRPRRDRHPPRQYRSASWRDARRPVAARCESAITTPATRTCCAWASRRPGCRSGSTALGGRGREDHHGFRRAALLRRFLRRPQLVAPGWPGSTPS